MLRHWMPLLVAALGVFMLAIIAGCEGRVLEQRSPLPDEDYEYLLAVVLDMSGSYTEQMRSDSGKAYRYFLRLAERYFRDRLGSNDKIILAQVSGNEKTLLWDGNPRSLQRDFPSQKAFNDFLLTHSDANGSRVHHAIADTLDYLQGYPGVATGKTKSAVFVLSDMLDNAPDSEQSKNRLLQVLADYGRRGGVVGFYWVEQAQVPIWRRHLKDAGFRNYVVESEIVSDPSVPRFE